MGVSLAKVARGGQRYYLEAVAAGAEDHRPPGGEPDGSWLGGAAEQLGLGGRVNAGQLDAVLAGADPQTGAVLSRTHNRVKVAGYDLVFAAPKSVSVLFALGDGPVAEQILAGHHQAVAATMGYLEREAVRARRGSGSNRRTVMTTGVVAAAFLHRTSRAPDPHLHTHVLVTNLVQDQDGRWSALDGRGLYLHSCTAGHLYRAHLRQELTARLGVSWARTALGVIDLEGIEPVVVRAFSRRRADIEAALAEQAASSPRAAHLAALTTRPAKDLGTSFESLVPQWRARAAGLGMGPEQLAAVGGRGTAGQASAPLAGEAAEHLDQVLVGPDGLTAHASSFSRQDVVRAVCEASLSGIGVGTVESRVDRLLASSLVRPLPGRLALRAADTLRRGDGRLVWGGVDAARWTTAEMVAVEEHMVQGAESRQAEQVGVARPAAVEAALARRRGLGPEVGRSVRALLASGAGVVVVAASTATLAGDGLDAAREAWEGSGLVVLGTGPGPGGVGRLEAASGVETVALTELLGTRGGPDGKTLRSVGVLVVDQAGHIDSRVLDRLLAQAGASRVKVVLVSDPRQVGMGDTGGWRRLADRLGTVTLDSPGLGPERAGGGLMADTGRGDESVGRSAANSVGRSAANSVGRSAANSTVSCQVGQSRVTVGPSLESARQRMVDDWWEARRAGQEAIMVAARPVDVRLLNTMALNTMARERLAAGGELDRGPPSGTSDPQPAFSVRQARSMDAAVRLVLGDSHTLARGRWSERARATAQLYVVDRGGVDREHEVLDRMDRLADGLDAGRLGRGPAPVASPARLADLSLADLAERREALGATLSRAAATLPPDPAPALAVLDQDRARVAAGLSAARAASELAAPGPPPGPERRRWGRWASRAASTPEPVHGDPAGVASPVTRWAAEAQRLDTCRAELGAEATRRAEWAVEHAGDLARYRQLGVAIDCRERVLTRAADAAPPAHLVAEMGERPASQTERAVWRRAARSVESYRERWGVSTPERAIDQPAGMGFDRPEPGRGPGPARSEGGRGTAGLGGERLSRRAERLQAVQDLEAARLDLQPELVRVGRERPALERSLARSAGRGLG